MNYKSFADLSKDIKSNLHKIPKDVSLVVGIPRSGLLAANLISLYANLPLTDIDSFIEGKVLCPGFHSSTEKALKGKILIVDDSVATGKAIIDARQKLKPITDAAVYKLLFCCIYADPEKKDLVDIPLLLLDRPRVFEWNLFHNKIMEKGGVNLQGVLAVGKKGPGTLEDGKHFKSLLTATPYIVPKKNIGSVFYVSKVDNEQATNTWLEQNGIQYSELIVMEKSDLGLEYKKRRNLTLFIEYQKKDAEVIFDKSGKDVYCIESNTMFTKKKASGIATSIQKKSKKLLQHLKRKMKTFL